MPEISKPSSPLLTRLFSFLPRLYFPLLALLGMAYCSLPLTANDDIWAHAAIGRWIIENNRLPGETLFIWGAAPIEWVYHSWLSQVVFFQFLRQGEVLGPLFIRLLTCVLVVAVFGLLWRAWRLRVRSTHVPVWMPPIFALAIYCSSLRFHPRPEIFTALFLTIVLLFLSRGKDERSQNWWAVCGLISAFILWANFHGAVAIGLLLLWATALCDIAQDGFQKRNISQRSKVHCLLAVLCSLAIFINPYGLEYWRALIPVGGETFSRIDEWKPFWRAPILNLNFIAGEAVLVMLALFFWLGNTERRWSQLAWLLLMSALFLSARRHLWLLPIVALSVMAANAPNVSTPSWNRFFAEGTRLFALVINARAAMVALLVIWLFVACPVPSQLGVLVAADLPRQASQFVQTRYDDARVFSDYENSSFLQWQFSGRPPLYIDLLNAYPDQLLLNYLDIAHARPRGQKLLDSQNIEVVILRKYVPESPLAKLAAHLNNQCDWRREYEKEDGTIWVRQNHESDHRVLPLR